MIILFLLIVMTSLHLPFQLLTYERYFWILKQDYCKSILYVMRIVDIIKYPCTSMPTNLFAETCTAAAVQVQIICAHYPEL